MPLLSKCNQLSEYVLVFLKLNPELNGFRFVCVCKRERENEQRRLNMIKRNTVYEY